LRNEGIVFVVFVVVLLFLVLMLLRIDVKRVVLEDFFFGVFIGEFKGLIVV